MRLPLTKPSAASLPPQQAQERLPGAPLQLRAAYAICRGIARSTAKNFYYGFLVLPRRKRNALCAVYAYMRHADDISDDPSLSTEERRTRLQSLSDSLHRAIAGEATDDPVLLALGDTQRRYNIPLEWLDQLVEGTAMDVQPGMAAPNSPNSPFATYETFADLYDYCYHVASVVGLVCIRIFGYRDPAAEPLAERCGIAFQLTNIIRDVKEDAELGRVYLPQEDLRRFGRSVSELAQAAASGDLAQRFRPLLEFEAERARGFYRSADELFPLIEDDSRPALWVLVEIYHRLLEKIAKRGYDVFGPKVRLSTAEKISVLLRGFWQRLI